MESSRDATLTNLVMAVRTSHIDVKQDQLQRILALVTASFEEGYHKGSRTFGKLVDEALVQQPVVALEAPARAKKKPA